MKIEFDIASDQIDGARDYQEDAYMVNQLGEAENGDICSLIIMADGMGGHAAGNVASNMVVATFNKTFQAKFPTPEIAEVLTDALNRSNDQIRASVKETPRWGVLEILCQFFNVQHNAVRRIDNDRQIRF